MSVQKKKRNLRNFLIYQVGAPILQQFEKLIPHYSKVGDAPFLDVSQFEWTQTLEMNWEMIRQELDGVLTHSERLPNFQDISPDQATSTSKDDLWKTYFLYGYGCRAEQNCQRCPETTRLIEQIPGMKTAFFSIMLPGKHIPEHRGPYKGVVRCLLGLKIPEPNEACRIRVHDQIRYWQEGKTMVFDDTYLHEAWNETDQIRVVLFLDIVRPLRFPLSWLNQVLIQLIAWSPYIRDAQANQKKWEQRFAQAVPREKADAVVKV
ncbi:aspartyl/asparaginyl beta-hydroxylase domain-containing protein [Acaryochloris sp. IP29b_bin.137]|uniref:aspartyl/asparaginyl beta-hydroxylase domain-containing protein n=1 Tax=Acaryochloris sp. IP29b_bin.137 TaxID=2969217 RepID=UPI002616F0E7|nr:aspartyl/asparaginyl beta-hydroxylase domain-containing protein [Acaryochloris sp. IP29b_bin.137]